MKDNLQDLIQHTFGLGVIDLVKVVGTTQETEITAVSEDKNVIITGKFNTPNAEFIGTCGMPNLGKLKTILGFDEYDDNAEIKISRVDRNGVDSPASIIFKTKTGDFVNEYRLMSKELVEDRVTVVNFKGAVWNVEFEPSVVGIQRLKKQSSANSEEDKFKIKTENGDLKIMFGDHSTHNGNFVFHPSVTGTLARQWQWPIKVFISIMDLPGNKTVRISDQGATEIIVDSGLATYIYRLPAHAK
jgi:hypothetical protein